MRDVLLVDGQRWRTRGCRCGGRFPHLDCKVGRDFVLLLILLIYPMLAFSQQPCVVGMHIDGIISDQTGAAIPGATVKAAGTAVTSDATGHYALACVPANTVITAQANGFANGTARTPARSAGKIHLNIQLTVASVQTDVQVSGDSDNDTGGDTTILNTKAVQGFADDPDDFLRELQVLASVAGGDPTTAVIMVDGAS